MESRKLIIGLGTGRCGTDSLTRVLNQQEGVTAQHETFFLTWKHDVVSGLLILNELLRRPGKEFVADVAFYWLNYVPDLCEMIPGIKFVCIWRDREKVVESFYEHTGDRNYWTSPMSVHWDLSNRYCIDPMMLSFPKYDLPKREGIGAYWDEYDRKAKAFSALYPSNFMYISTEDALNTHEGLKSVLDFIKIPEENRDYCVGMRSNVRNTVSVDFEPLGDDSSVKCAACNERATQIVRVIAYGIMSFSCADCELDIVKRYGKPRKAIYNKKGIRDELRKS